MSQNSVCLLSYDFRSLKSRVKILVDGTLLIPNLIPEDAGNYTCIPTNGLLTPPSASAYLTVKRKALISMLPYTHTYFVNAYVWPIFLVTEKIIIFSFYSLRPCSCGSNVPGDIFTHRDGGSDRLPCPGQPPCTLCQLDQRWK